VSSLPPFVPQPPAEKGEAASHAAVLRQLERLLKSAPFRNSRRYPNLLRYVVERTLKGHSDELKERNLGVAVFGRAHDFDPSVDPVVRTSAGEVRKRIAQYYQDPEHQGEVRIEIPLGSYVPNFHFPREASPQGEVFQANGSRDQRWFRPFALAFAVILVIAAAWASPWVRPSAVDAFWKPVLGSGDSVILCVAPGPAQQGIAWGDVKAVAKLAGLIQSQGRAYSLRQAGHINFSEMELGPAVLAGSLEADWMSRLTSSARYGFAREGTASWIRDKANPSDRRWSIDTANPVSGEDYAIISRILHAATGKPVLIAAGLSASGTAAAAEYLTDAAKIRDLVAHGPADWESKNIQIVVRVDVNNGSFGPAHVVASYFW
jgi:hypothetical protein